MPKKVSFKIVHASGADDGHSAKELEVHSPTTKGWQSSRFCIYPQEVVLMLAEAKRIRKLQILAHQFLIPTKVEIYIGNVGENQVPSLMSCDFKRLGYVSLVDNQSTNYKARELKSVHLDAHGQFVKLVVHKNHVNKYNLFNQVNIIAVNIIADDIENYPELDGSKTNVNKLVDQYMKQDNFSNDPLWGKINRPDFISPLDDLSFDMYQDPETASLIRRLEAKKKDAIKEERFDDAKQYKQTMTDLHKVGERLGRLNVEKNKAIELEDFDLAKDKKRQVDEYRLYVYKHLNLTSILGQSEVEEPNVDSNLLSPKSPPLPPIKPHQPPVNDPQVTNEPEAPVVKTSPTRLSPIPSAEEVVAESPKISNTAVIGQDDGADERPLPTLSKIESQENTEHPTKENEPPLKDVELAVLKEKDAREASLAIDVFGEDVVRRLYTKQWTYRQQGLEMIKRELTSSEAEMIKDRDAKSVIRAVVEVLKKGFKEQVHPVFTLCLSIMKDLLTIYIPKQDATNDIPFVIDKTLPLLLLKTGEMAARMKGSALEFIVEIAQYEDVKSTKIIPDLVTHPFKTKQQTPARLYTGRIELLGQLLGVLGHESSSPTGLSTVPVMKLILPALEHSSGEVRDAAVKLIFELYKLKAPVKDHLPADEPATRKNPLYRSIFDGFDKIDGKPTESERKAKAKQDRLDAEKGKQQEIAALQAQLNALKQMAEQGNTDKPKTTPEDTAGPTQEPTDIDRMCIFCGEVNETFTEEILDIHYWKACPMLKRCEKCTQVYEICRTNQHLLEECESKKQFAPCPKCKEVILKTDLDNHAHEKLCSKKPGNRCSLCQKIVGATEEAWRAHLTKQCSPNTKRLQQLKQLGNKMPVHASMTSLRAKGTTKHAAKAAKTSKTTAPKTLPRKDKGKTTT